MRTAACGRLCDFTNGRFVAFHRIKGESSRMTASGKVEGRLRVGLRQTPVEIRCRKPVIEVSLPETGRSDRDNLILAWYFSLAT